MFYIVHEDSFTMAARPPEGKLPAPQFKTLQLADAIAFDDHATASEASQNFGPEWWVEEI